MNKLSFNEKNVGIRFNCSNCNTEHSWQKMESRPSVEISDSRVTKDTCWEFEFFEFTFILLFNNTRFIFQDYTVGAQVFSFVHFIYWSNPWIWLILLRQWMVIRLVHILTSIHRKFFLTRLIGCVNIFSMNQPWTCPERYKQEVMKLNLKA